MLGVGSSETANVHSYSINEGNEDQLRSASKLLPP